MIMPDREKVIKGLTHCMNGFGCFGCPYSVANKSSPDCQLKNGRDALELLKKQEHKDRMFHALEDDWKRLKELLKEQEAVVPKKGKTPEESAFDCGNCGYPLWEDELYCAHCGRPVKWE